MQDFLGDPDDIESENTIYFDQSKKLIFKDLPNDDPIEPNTSAHPG